MATETLDIEISLIGLCLVEPMNFAAAMSLRITPAHFSDDVLGGIYGEMAALESRGDANDFEALCFKHPEWRRRLVDCLEKAPMTQNVAFFARELSISYWARVVGYRASEIAEKAANRVAFTEAESLRDAIAKFSDQALVDPGEPDGGPREAPEILASLSDSTERRTVDFRRGITRGISTGLPSLDAQIFGFVPGFVYIIGARTGVGKTTLASHCALEAAHQGKWVCYFSTEQDAEELMTKLISRQAGIVGSKIQAGSLTDDELDAFHAASATIARLPLAIDNSFGTSFERIKLTCQTRRRQGKLDLVIVDYVQELEMAGSHFSRAEQLRKIGSGMRQIARQMKVPVILLAQLNRESVSYQGKTNDGPPELHQIKDSGSFEQDADCCMLLYNRKVSGVDVFGTERQEVRSFLYTAKNRHGKSGQIELDIDYGRNRIREKGDADVSV